MLKSMRAKNIASVFNKIKSIFKYNQDTRDYKGKIKRSNKFINESNLAYV